MMNEVVFVEAVASATAPCLRLSTGTLGGFRCKVRNNFVNRQLLLSFYRVKNRSVLGFTGMLFEGEYRFTKKMVADFYEDEERTIELLLEEHNDELKYNGYVLSKGKQLKKFKLQFAPVINVGSKTTQLGLFNFRAVLNTAA